MSGIGFRYAIDRSFIDILKELHFLSDSGMPTKRYMDFHKLVDAREILLDGIHEAYSKLFALHPDASDLSEQQVADALKQLYNGKKTDMMISGIASTFLALCRFADNTDATATAVQQTRNATKNAQQRTYSPAQTPPPSETAAAQETAPPQQPDATAASESEPLLLGPEFEVTTEAAPASEPAPAPPVAVATKPAAPPAASAPDTPVPADLLPEPAAVGEAAMPPSPPHAPAPGRETPSTTQAAPPPAATPEPLVLKLESEADTATPAPAAATAPQGGDDVTYAAPAFSDAAAPVPLVLELEPDASVAAPPAAAPEPMPLILETEADGDAADTPPAMPEPVATQAAPEPELPVLERDTPLVTVQPEAPAPADAGRPAPMSQSLTPVFEPQAPEALRLETPEPGGETDNPLMATTLAAMEDATPADAPQPADAATPPPAPDVALADATAQRQLERTGIPPSLVFDLDALPLKETPPGNDAAAAAKDEAHDAPAACHGTGEGAAKSMRCPIQIVLPESTDAAVYDAIFTSLKRHMFTPGE